jgi:conjugal transfer mating pair stabilization protein TraN
MMIVKKVANITLWITVLLVLMLSAVNVLANNVAEGFAKREEYKDATKLGDPKQMSGFANPDADVSHLQNLNDASLLNKGAEMRSDKAGDLLRQAQEKKTDAIGRYKINSENSLIKNAEKIQKNALKDTGGEELSIEEEIEEEKTEKSCIEGVEFDVDVGLELVLNVKEEEYLSPVKSEHRKIRFKGDVLHNQRSSWGFAIKWKTGRWGWHISPHHPKVWWNLQVDSIWKDNPAAIIADARSYIASQVGIPIEQVGENIQFPGAGRGIGNIKSVGHRWRVVWDEYEFGYDYLWQDKLTRLVEGEEYWQVVTEGMEELLESNECYEVNRVCLKKGVKTFLGKYDVSRPCWYEQVSYKCQSEPKDGCKHLEKCKEKDAKCEHKIGSLCLKWKRDFVCGGTKKKIKYSAKPEIYCLGGNCHTPIIEENRNFANVAHLAALNEAKNDCVKETEGICKKPIQVFPGENQNCKKIITGFVNCCSSMKGWGKDIGLSQCSGEEKGLALKRERGNCHNVGTYCSSRDPVFGKCLKKKTSFCCFASKLARIFHEQGRKQLAINWGTPKKPNCRPFTIEELSSLDFSKFDLQELADALLDKGNKSKKSFLDLKAGEIPAIQKEHMKTSGLEKREIRKREKQERLDKIRREKEEEERKERERVQILEAERLERERVQRLEEERLERERQARVKSNRELYDEQVAASKQRKEEIINELKRLGMEKGTRYQEWMQHLGASNGEEYQNRYRDAGMKYHQYMKMMEHPNSEFRKHLTIVNNPYDPNIKYPR